MKPADAVLRNALKKLKESGDKTLKISTEIIQGPPRQVIVEEVEKWGADLIVMGSRGLYLESPVAGISIECGGSSREMFRRNRAKSGHGK